MPQARVVETLGNPQDQRKISLIAVHAHGIPDEFPHAVLAEVETLEPPKLAGRTDLRALDLLTIDPVDARDHDDAVHAAPDTDPGNAGGWIVHVAIADVAHYVRPGTRLDREAQMRGNSVYFPDRVVPMLPERISNDLCSLQRGRGAALPRRAHGLRQARQQEEPHLPARHDALGRQAVLRGGAGRHRRPAERQGRAAAGDARSSRCGPPTRRWRPRATGASRSTSTCPSARS